MHNNEPEKRGLSVSMREIPEENNPKILMDLAKAGDRGAFEKLYGIFFTPIYRYIFLRVKDKSEVELLTQDVFIKVYKSIGQFELKNGTTPLPYFFTIARNTIIDYWRKNRNKVSFGKEDLMMQIPDRSDGPVENAEKKEAVAMLYKSLNKITHEQREALTLRYFHDMPNRDIGKYMGKSEEAVRQLQSRALKSLRNILRESNS